MWHVLHQHQQSYRSKQYLLSVSFLLSEWSEEGYEEPSHFTQCLMSIYHNETVSFDVADDDMLPSWYPVLAFAHTTVTGDPRWEILMLSKYRRLLSQDDVWYIPLFHR